jgi:glycosyltransferase involved in cell wall biosynthesis
VGWNWAIWLASAGHDVTVLTRPMSREAINRVVADLPDRDRLRFEYFDLPRVMRWHPRGPLHIYATIWQWRAVRFARKLHAVSRFDVVHHVTYAGIHLPTFMGFLGIPFIFGPVGGGETAPWSLRFGMGFRGLLLDLLRDLSNAFVRFDPQLGKILDQADRIYVTSHETLMLLPACHRHKADIELAIAVSAQDGDRTMDLSPRCDEKAPRVLFAGRFVAYKGMHLGLPAFAQMLTVYPAAQLTIVGDGPRKAHWQRLAKRLGIQDRITWLPWQRHEQMGRIYRDHDILLFPCIHESGGFVLLEALAHGLPAVCLEIGGPGTIMDNTCGKTIETAGKSRSLVTKELGDGLIALADPTLNREMSKGALARSRHFSWPQKVDRVYGRFSRNLSRTTVIGSPVRERRDRLAEGLRMSLHAVAPLPVLARPLLTFVPRRAQRCAPRAP